MALDLIDKQFEFNLWANTQLISLCTTLSEEQLAVEVTGIYGQIQPTIAHIVRAEGNYIRALTGTNPWAADTDWDGFSISSLLKMAQQSGGRLRELATTVDPATSCDRVEGTGTYTLWVWTALCQALNHSTEHRTQIRVLLTKLGIPHSDGSVWRFNEAQYDGGFKKK